MGALKSSVVFWSPTLGRCVLIHTQELSHGFSEGFEKALGVRVIFSFTAASSRFGTRIIDYYKSTINGLSSAASLLKNVVRIAVYSVGGLVILDFK